MSLFKAKEWWSKKLGSDSEFDHGCLVVGWIGPLSQQESVGSDMVALGSQTGLLRIYMPRLDADKAYSRDGPVPQATDVGDDMLLEYACKDGGILQLSVGRFVSTLANVNTLAVLHSRKLVVYTLHHRHGTVEHGEQWSLTVAYEHVLQRAAFTMCYGPFGFTGTGRDLICVMSVDCSVSMFEQESPAFTRFLPDSLLPGPICYLPQIDMFVTAASGRQLEAYKYQVLAVYKDATTPNTLNVPVRDGAGDPGDLDTQSGKRVPVEWSFNMGECVVDLKTALAGSHGHLIVALTRHHIFCVNSSGALHFQKRLNFSGQALHIHRVSEAGQMNYLVATDTKQIVVFRDQQIVWVACMEVPVVDISVGRFPGIQGAIVTLSESGWLQGFFLGTDPSATIIPLNWDSREINYETAEAELQRLQSRIKATGVNKEKTDMQMLSKVRSENELTLQVQLASGLDSVSQARKVRFTSPGVKIPSTSFTVHLKPKTHINNVLLQIVPPLPFSATESRRLFSHLESSQGGQFNASMFISSPMVPWDVNVKVLATYRNMNDAYRVAQTQFQLPLTLCLVAAEPVKQANCKLTLELSETPIPLHRLFPEFVSSAAGQEDPNVASSGSAMGFQFVGGGPVVTILLAKSSNRYRIQADYLEAMWVVTRELVSRINAKGQVRMSFNEGLPLAEYFDVLDRHFEARMRVEEVENILKQRANQFRAIQKRLLTRFKDKTPTPLQNLDGLLESSIHQMTELSDLMDASMYHLHACTTAVNAATHLLCLHVALSQGWTETSSEWEALLNCLCASYNTPLDPGFEEYVDAALLHSLRTTFSRGAKDVSSNFTELKRPTDIGLVKKHIAMVLEKVGQGMSPSSKSMSSSSSRSAMKPPSSTSMALIVEEPPQAGLDTMEDNRFNVSNFRSPRNKEKRKSKKKKDKTRMAEQFPLMEDPVDESQTSGSSRRHSNKKAHFDPTLDNDDEYSSSRFSDKHVDESFIHSRLPTGSEPVGIPDDEDESAAFYA